MCVICDPAPMNYLDQVHEEKEEQKRFGENKQRKIILNQIPDNQNTRDLVPIGKMIFLKDQEIKKS